MYIHIYIYTCHTHIHIYIYIYSTSPSLRVLFLGVVFPPFGSAQTPAPSAHLLAGLLRHCGRLRPIFKPIISKF